LIDWLGYLVLAATAFCASSIGAIAGSGSTAILLPVLSVFVGVREALPILTIANLASNLGRVWFNRKEISLPVVGWFSLGSIPLALAGSWLFVVTPPVVLMRILGGFLLVIVIWHRLRPLPPKFESAKLFAPLGAVFGLLNGLLEGVGPLMAPFFLAFGLIRGSYIGTDALATTVMQIAKLGVLGGANVIGETTLLIGLILVPFMLAGAFAGKKVLDRVSERLFVTIIDVTLLIAAVNFLFVR